MRNAPGWRPSFNRAAALLGPVFMAARAARVLFWLILLLDCLAVAQIATATSGTLGADQQARADRLAQQAATRSADAQAAAASGQANASGLNASAAGLKRAAETAAAEAARARSKGPWLAATGLLTLVAGRLLGAVLANGAMERRFARWRSERRLRHGLDRRAAAAAAAFCALSYGLVAYRFAATTLPDWLRTVPTDRAWQAALASALDRTLETISRDGGTVFAGFTAAISAVLDSFAFALIATPWPITMATILALAWQLAGARVAVLTAAALAYLGLLGFWEKSLETVALLGTSAALCLAIGIPLGIWCGRRPRLYAALRPVLDFMQTMPAFVYLIPVIALFGIGKPPGVIATLIFGTPPAVRLTALGIRGVPGSVREAAQAFGATRWFVLTRVDLPLAWASIMTGVNQTILMCLSMVVIASLIGAKGLGEDVLNALQYAAVGQGLLAGLAILLCAMVIDRLVQGRVT